MEEMKLLMKLCKDDIEAREILAYYYSFGDKILTSFDINLCFDELENIGRNDIRDELKKIVYKKLEEEDI